MREKKHTDKREHLIRDVVEAAVSEATFRLTCEKMRKTLGIKINGDPVKAVEVLAARYLLNEHERGGVLRTLITEAELSGYGLVNAVTGFAQQVDDYDRSTQLEAIGGRMLDQTLSEWRSLVEAA